MSDLIFERWKEFLTEEKHHRDGKRTKVYAGSPIEPNGHSEETNEKNKRKRQKKVAGMGMLDAFHDDEKDLLNTNALFDEDKEKKPLCKPVNPYHDKETGKFASKDSVGSWSVDYGGSGGADGCERGVLRKPSKSQHKVWTKAGDCGRRGKWKCGEKNTLRKPFQTKTKLEEAVRRELNSLLGEYADWYDSQEVITEDGIDNKKLYSICKERFNLLTFKDFLIAQNRLVASSKGDLLKQKKA